eukprot:14066036-Heterocapsa_arctica.AAC.1
MLAAIARARRSAEQMSPLPTGRPRSSPKKSSGASNGWSVMTMRGSSGSGETNTSSGVSLGC